MNDKSNRVIMIQEFSYQKNNVFLFYLILIIARQVMAEIIPAHGMVSTHAQTI